MGMPPNKHWALLKPSENTVAGLGLGKLMDMAWTPDFRPVEVMLNGDYIGLYFLTETIRISENRVDIYEQKDGETNPSLIKGGWLVEVDNYRDDCQITVPRMQPMEPDYPLSFARKSVGTSVAMAHRRVQGH